VKAYLDSINKLINITNNNNNNNNHVVEKL